MSGAAPPSSPRPAPYSAEQLARLAGLADALLDQPAAERADWLQAAAQAHPDLARALAAMAADAPAAGATGPALTVPAGDGALDDAGHRPGDTVGPYRLERLLGAGGMGTVWLAEQADGRLRRKVALKLLRPGHTHPGWRLRFERERDILAGLDHPGIARLFEAGSAPDGQPFMAMQYVAGEPLGRFAAARRLGVAERVRLVVELLGAVQHAHALLVIHRDLKPGNILVDEASRVVLLDFGIAKPMANAPAGGPGGDAAAGTLTALAGSALTPDYASPEQVAGRPVGIGTDIYSLGVVLYELLCGQRPYRLQRGSRAAVEQAILEQDLQPPSRRVVDAHAVAMGLTPRVLARRLRGDLDTIVLKALRREPTERYATAEALADDLRRWLDGRPVAAQPPRRWYLAQRFVRRHRWAVAGAALTVAGLAGGLGIALWQARVARQEAAVAKATEAFLTSMLSANGMNQADPAKASNMTARELLDLGVRRIGTELKDAPEVRLRLLQTLAGIYNERGLFTQTLGLEQQIYVLRRTLHPEAKEAQFDDLMDLALVQIEINPDDGAGRWLDAAEHLLDAMHDLTSVRRGRLELQRAEFGMADKRDCLAHVRKAVAVLRPLTLEGTELLDALFIQSLCERDAGDPRAALATAQEALRLQDARHIEINRGSKLAAIALAQLRLGRLGAALETQRQQYELAVRQLGADLYDSSDGLSVVGGRADFLAQTAQARAGVALLAPVLDRLRHGVRIPERYMYIFVRTTLAQIRNRLGQAAQALADLADAQGELDKLGPSDLLAARLLDTRAGALVIAGRLDEAEDPLRQAAELHRKLHHEGSQLVDHVTALVRLRLAQHRPDDAERALGDYFIDRIAGEPATPTALDHDTMLAEIRIAQSRWRDAADQAAAVLKTLSTHPEARYLAGIEARALLASGTALLGLGQPAAATAPLRQAASLFARLTDPQVSPLLAQTHERLAQATKARAEPARARAL